MSFFGTYINLVKMFGKQMNGCLTKYLKLFDSQLNGLTMNLWEFMDGRMAL